MLEKIILIKYKREYKKTRENMKMIQDMISQEQDPKYKVILQLYYDQHLEYARDLKEAINSYIS